MITRGPDRRWRPRTPELLLPERRDGFDQRAPCAAASPPSAIRIGYGEAAPQRERRRFPESGLE